MPDTVIVAVRVAPPFCVHAYVIVPLPVPLVPELIVSHVALLVAVHEQYELEVTAIDDDPLAAETEAVDGASVCWQSFDALLPAN